MAGEQAPKVKTFACTSCGAAITIRNANSLSAVCPTCHAVIDPTDENYKILSTYFRGSDDYTKQLEFGMRGVLFGRPWEAIGFLVRRDVASNYQWKEYLLFNPYYGYRWLIEDRGHWNFVTPIKDKPKSGPDSISVIRSVSVKFDRRSYRVYNRGDAQIVYVEGEFYWQVLAAQIVTMSDFISPPYMLSCELDNSQVVWSKSQYVEHTVVKNAFKLEKLTPPSYLYISANQPSAVGRIFDDLKPFWCGFLLLTLIIQIYHYSTAWNKVEFEKTYAFKTNTKVENAITTPVFVLDKALSNVEIELTASVDNSWLYLAGEMVNDKTGETYPFERSIEYYHGYDGGESWTEGSSHASLAISRIPSGLYYINLDYESSGFKAKQSIFKIAVRRDAPNYSNFFWILIALSIIPTWYGLRSLSFEKARWVNSDFSPYETGG